LVDVPAGSTNVKINELGGTFNFIGKTIEIFSDCFDMPHLSLSKDL